MLPPDEVLLDDAVVDGLSDLALSIARCGEVEPARSDGSHPCHMIVSSQRGLRQAWQVPEPWAGALHTASVVFVSSNPSISVAPTGKPEVAEDYPTEVWTDDATAAFVTDRFSHWATLDGRYRQVDGELSRPVPFWRRVRDRAREILGPGADPRSNYAMTEIVHCKSRAELGVSEAASHCAELHLARILDACPAGLVVVLGARARDQAIRLWGLSPRFGRGPRPGDEATHREVRHLAGRDRLIIHLPHPTSMEPASRLGDAFPTLLPQIRAWAGASSAPRPLDSMPGGSMVEAAHTSRSAPVTDDVVIVAAGNAWPFYRQAAAYVCRSGRSFRPVSYLGFYSQRTIHGAVAAIESVYDNVVLNQTEAARLALSLDGAEQRLGNVIAAALSSAWKEGESCKIILLSPLGGPQTQKFTPIPHHGRSAWTMSQRYANLSALTDAKTTDDLVEEPA